MKRIYLGNHRSTIKRFFKPKKKDIVKAIKFYYTYWIKAYIKAFEEFCNKMAYIPEEERKLF